MKSLHGISFVLLVIGGLNWLLVGLFSWNLVEAIFGDSIIAKIVYILVGLATLIVIFTGRKSATPVAAPQM